MDSDFNSAAITDVVLVADTDVADFALAAGGEKGVICAQCGAGPSTYPPAPTLAERTLQRAIEVQHDIAVMECLILAMDTAPEKTPPKEKFYEPAIVWRCKFQPGWLAITVVVIEHAGQSLSLLKSPNASKSLEFRDGTGTLMHWLGTDWTHMASVYLAEC